MKWRITSIRSKLLLSFLLFVLVTCGIVALNLWLNGRREEVANINTRLNRIELEVQRLKRIEGDFLKDEVINPNFYNTQESRLLAQHSRILARVQEHLAEMQAHTEVHRPRITRKIKTIKRQLIAYQQAFFALREAVLARGFKDFGLEGSMRICIHQIEALSAAQKLDLSKLLAIRRIEKDFMLRKEWRYTSDIIEALDIFRAEVEAKVFDLPTKRKLFELLGYYQSDFRRIAYTERNIGFNADAGIRHRLAQLSKDIEEHTADLGKDVAAITQDLNTQSITMFIAIIVAAVILLIFLAFFLTYALTRPIHELSRRIHHVIAHQFSPHVAFQTLPTQDEIGRLSTDFGLMLRTVQASIAQIQNQSEKIALKQQALMESLRYAHTIQQAILPDDDDFRQYFREYFVLYKPLHTVSGDFYWLTEQRGLVFLAAVDCTGHGVPGAFMSMVGNALLGKIINEKEIFDPAEVLELLDGEVKQALRQERDKNNDGMELSLVRFDGLFRQDTPITLTFAGAKSKWFYTQDGILHKEKSVRRAIGGKQDDGKSLLTPFENHVVVLSRGEKVYLATDGYCDQPNAKRKKFSTKNFMQIIQENSLLDLPAQGACLEDALITHLEDPQDQRDDITVIGVRL